MLKLFKVCIPAQEFEVEAEDEDDAMLEAQSLVDIDSIDCIGGDECE